MGERDRPATARCPSCGRPIALTRPSCLYCGRPLPEELLPAPVERAEPPTAQALLGGVDDGKTLLVARLEDATVESLAVALDRTVLEAGQLVRRGGWALLGVLPEDVANQRRERLGRAGVRCLVLEQAEVRLAIDPWLAIGAHFDGRLHLRRDGASRVVSPGELCLVVAGAIRREYQARETKPRGFRSATLEQGHRFHLHRRDDPAPIELDPAGIEFDEESGGAESSLLRIDRWVSTLIGDGPRDDLFRFLPPALAPAAPAPEIGALTAAGRLRRGPAEDAVILDNLAQFRFYSAWRACVQRRLDDG
jgi:hypothetical protein